MAAQITQETKSILDETTKNYKEYHNPALARLVKFAGYNSVEWRTDGVFVYDHEGKEFLDCAAGYGVFSLGHRNPDVIAAVKDQLDKMPLSPKVFFNHLLGELCARLAALAPGDLRYTFVCNSGAEAVEGALKLARLKTGKPGIISTIDSFHGKTFGALSASGRELFKAPFRPLLEHFSQVPFGDIEALERAIDDNTAAVILEPIQGEGGVNIPPDDYFPKVEKLCRDKNVLFIADEVQTGLGRTGTLFGVNHWNVKPDIMALAKTLGGGVMPIGAFMGTPAVWDAFRSNPTIHTSTFGGNPLACRAALAALEVITRDNLPERAERMGKIFMDALRGLQEEFPEIIGEVRGKGLLIGIEMAEEKFGGAMIYELARAGIIGVYTLNKPRVIRVEPPLIIKEEHIRRATEGFRFALGKTRNLFKTKT